MKKRALSLVLATSMTAAMMAGCGNGTPAATDAAPATTAANAGDQLVTGSVFHHSKPEGNDRADVKA